MQYLIYDPTGLAGTTTEKNGGDGAKEDLDIEPERPLVDIFEIKANPIREILYFVAA
jgi:hypothetical protein